MNNRGDVLAYSLYSPDNSPNLVLFSSDGAHLVAQNNKPAPGGANFTNLHYYLAKTGMSLARRVRPRATSHGIADSLQKRSFVHFNQCPDKFPITPLSRKLCSAFAYRPSG